MFKKGDVVVCISTSPRTSLKLGEKYTIEYVINNQAVLIKELLNNGGILSNRFILLTEYRILKIKKLYENKKRIC
jgi:hypothetical protein